MLQTTLTLINLHWQGKSQPYELSKSKKKKKKNWKNIQGFKNDCLVVFSPSHWKTTNCLLYFACQIELKGSQIDQD